LSSFHKKNKKKEIEPSGDYGKKQVWLDTTAIPVMWEAVQTWAKV
jgi:hypothetical protein